MKAAVLNATGECFAIEEIEIDSPKVREVLVQYCGHCKACLDGRTYQCLQPEETLRAPDQAQRLTRDGKPVTDLFGTAAFAEYALVHENQLARVPKELPFPQASLLGCGCVTGAGAAINTAGMRAGKTVAIPGVGGVGLNVISGVRGSEISKALNGPRQKQWPWAA